MRWVRENLSSGCRSLDTMRFQNYLASSILTNEKAEFQPTPIDELKNIS